MLYVTTVSYVCREWEGAAGHRGCGHETCGRENPWQTVGQDAFWQSRVHLRHHLYYLKGTDKNQIKKNSEEKDPGKVYVPRSFWSQVSITSYILGLSSQVCAAGTAFTVMIASLSIIFSKHNCILLQIQFAYNNLKVVKINRIKFNTALI